MQYTARLVVGFLAAILWSGGWPWRAPRLLILVGVLPPSVGLGEEAREMLNWLTDIPSSEIPSWWFYMFGLGAAVIVMAARLAYLETTKIQLCNLDVYNDGNGTEWVRILIKNISLTEIREDLVVRQVDLTRDPIQPDDKPINLPLVLTSQERMKAVQAGDQHPYYGKLSLDAGASPKSIELFQVIRKAKIEIIHQTGMETIYLGNHLFKYEVTASGHNITFWVKYLYSKGSHMVMLAKDMAMLNVFDELGDKDWWHLDGTR